MTTQVVRESFPRPAENESANHWLIGIMVIVLCLSLALLLLNLTFNRLNLIAGAFGLSVLTLYSGLVGNFAYRLFRGRNLISSTIVIIGGMMVVIVILMSLVDLLRLSSLPIFGAGIILLPLILADSMCLGIYQARNSLVARVRERYTITK